MGIDVARLDSNSERVRLGDARVVLPRDSVEAALERSDLEFVRVRPCGMDRVDAASKLLPFDM